MIKEEEEEDEEKLEKEHIVGDQKTTLEQDAVRAKMFLDEWEEVGSTLKARLGK